ncbi:MAG: bifunctional aspartate kinase/homoserine dehydrogenase I [Duncaniella sp.]|nr:bifunctional aspartate kinase/homoserine dehydrogenase I [Duncaniella sp.]
MKVMKFGGSSLCSTEGLANIVEIIKGCIAEGQRLTVVVSAIASITDLLVETANLASKGGTAYRERLDQVAALHFSLLNSYFAPGEVPAPLRADIERLLADLESVLRGVSLLRDLSSKSLDLICSYGELIASCIVGYLLEGCASVDARDVVITELRDSTNVVDLKLSLHLIRETISSALDASPAGVAVMAGYIASDKLTGRTTTLGRGGSDYTASLVAAAMDADVLEIWTHVNGFLTANPRMISEAYTIPHLTYSEATELCNFGSKVIFPPSIYPVCQAGIPIRIRNTYNPSLPGTVISANPDPSDRRQIKGISSISGSALITVTGVAMLGVIGINRRIFTSLALHGISVFMVSQASSENSTSIGVSEADALRAADVLSREFEGEIAAGAVQPVRVERGLATVAIVGENMRRSPGVSGRLFRTLGRAGISVIASAQGAGETNISVVIDGRALPKAISLIHDAFFLSEYNEVNLFICGVGTVGSRLLHQIASQQEELKKTQRLKLNVVGIASSRRAYFAPEGLNPADFRNLLDNHGHESTAQSFAREVIDLNLYNSVFVDCTASAEVAALYRPLLSENISVVTANKIAASGPYEEYRALKDIALKRGVKFLFETNVGAGLPLIGTIGDLRASGDRILRIEAVLSGTLNYIFNALSSSTPLSKAVAEAKEKGYSEPDPRIDLSGLDVLRKLVILTREAGYEVEKSDVEATPFIPAELFEGSIEAFWEKLPALDEAFEARRRELEAQGRRLRYVARMEGGRMTVGLVDVDSSHPFYRLEGSTNIILLTTRRYREYPMQIQGYGAGAEVTAAGVFANIISTANTANSDR